MRMRHGKNGIPPREEKGAKTDWKLSHFILVVGFVIFLCRAWITETIMTKEIGETIIQTFQKNTEETTESAGTAEMTSTKEAEALQSSPENGNENTKETTVSTETAEMTSTEEAEALQSSPENGNENTKETIVSTGTAETTKTKEAEALQSSPENGNENTKETTVSTGTAETTKTKEAEALQLSPQNTNGTNDDSGGGGTSECADFEQTNEDLWPTPLWTPAYPGSGSVMFTYLVRATTGLPGHWAYNTDSCTRQRAFTCTTHWPAIRNGYGFGDPIGGKLRSDRALLLIRNPRNAIPSYFNWQWEAKNKIKTHSEQAPESEWRNWRDGVFRRQMGKWKDMITRWQQLQNTTTVLYVPYEKLTDDTDGPLMMQRIVNEIRKQPAVNRSTHESAVFNVAPDKDIPCLWRRVVKGDGRSKSKRVKKYTPSYTQEQKQKLLDMLDHAIQQEFVDAPLNILDILQVYRDDIAVNTPLDSDGEEDPTVKA